MFYLIQVRKNITSFEGLVVVGYQPVVEEEDRGRVYALQEHHWPPQVQSPEVLPRPDVPQAQAFQASTFA